LCPNWLTPDPTGIESVFIDFKVFYYYNNGDIIISQKMRGLVEGPLLVGGLAAPPPKSGPDIIRL